MFPWHCELSKHFPFSQQCNTHNIYSPILALSCSCKTCALCVLWIIYDQQTNYATMKTIDKSFFVGAVKYKHQETTSTF